MTELTAFERALLAQFETLAKASETSLDASNSTSMQLRDFSTVIVRRLKEIEDRQRAIESTNAKLLSALNAQSAHTENLVTQVNKLLKER